MISSGARPFSNEKWTLAKAKVLFLHILVFSGFLFAAEDTQRALRQGQQEELERMAMQLADSVNA